MKKIILILIAVSLSGCYQDSNIFHSPAYNKINDKINDIKVSSKQELKKIEERKTRLLPIVIQSGIVDDFYVDTEVFNKKTETYLPPKFYEQLDIEIDGKVDDIIAEVQSFVMNATGMPVEIENVSSTPKSAPSSAPSNSTASPLSPSPLPMPTGNYTKPAPAQSSDGDIYLSFSGQLKDLIKKIASMKKMKWKYDKDSNTIQLYATTTLIYSLPIPEHKTSAKIDVVSTASTSSGSGGGSTNSSLSSQSASNPRESIISGISQVISTSGSFSTNKETGLVEITDLHSHVNKIDKYMKKLINLYSSQLLVDVRVLHLSNTKKEAKEINWTSINNKIGSVIAQSTFGNPSGISSAATLLLGYKKDPEASSNNISTAINLLSNYAESYSVDSFSAITTNFRSVPIQLSASAVYFDKSTNTSVATTEASSQNSVTYTAKEKQLGTTITLTPSIINNDISLSYVFQKTHQSSVVTDPEGNAYPLTSTKTFVQNVKLKNSIPMVISAINTAESRNNSSSPLSTNLWFMGGSESTESTETQDIVLVTVSRLHTDIKPNISTYYDDKIMSMSAFLKEGR